MEQPASQMTTHREEGVQAGFFSSDQCLPYVMQPLNGRQPLLSWAREHREFVQEHLRQHGAILWRDFDLDGVAEFQAVAESLSSRAMEYQDRAAPRTQVSGRVYTATDFPPEHRIFLHNESSFAHTWPAKIFFFCAVPAAEGGETPLADVRRVFQRIPTGIRERFRRDKVMYVRNFGGRPFGLPWQEVFQVEDEAAMEDYCRRAAIDVEWRPGGKLRTRQVRPAILKHPDTGELAWFNHAAALHVSTLEPKSRAAMERIFKEEDLPNNTYYGDGSPIDGEDLEAIRTAYQEETVVFPWKRHDMLLLDNRLVAHGRHPYSGHREVVVSLADPQDWSDNETPSSQHR